MPDTLKRDSVQSVTKTASSQGHRTPNPQHSAVKNTQKHGGSEWRQSLRDHREELRNLGLVGGWPRRRSSSTSNKKANIKTSLSSSLPKEAIIPARKTPEVDENSAPTSPMSSPSKRLPRGNSKSSQILGISTTDFNKRPLPELPQVSPRSATKPKHKKDKTQAVDDQAVKQQRRALESIDANEIKKDRSPARSVSSEPACSSQALSGGNNALGLSNVQGISIPTSIHLRTGSVVTFILPEHTPWQRSVYLNGPIRLDDLHTRSRKTSLANMDMFAGAVETFEGTNMQRRSSDDAAMDDIVDFFEDFAVRDAKDSPKTDSSCPSSTEMKQSEQVMPSPVITTSAPPAPTGSPSLSSPSRSPSTSKKPPKSPLLGGSVRAFNKLMRR